MLPSALRVATLTSAALIAFALNSILCRLALRPVWIDAGWFTIVRLSSGAVALTLLHWVLPVRRGSSNERRLEPLTTQGPAREEERQRGSRRHMLRSLLPAFALFAYATPFSYSYTRLAAGVGALILFGTVQATMIGFDIAIGNRPRAGEWAGLFLSLGGLGALTVPGSNAPDWLASSWMAVAGIAWGAYSLLGRGAPDPLGQTAANFRKSVLFCPLLLLGVWSSGHISWLGFVLASTSGMVTSGAGYAIWYAALRHLTATRAALVQLSVPVLAMIGGLVVLGESISLHDSICATVILGGVALSVLQRTTQKKRAARVG